MAKKPSRRSRRQMGKYLRGTVDEDLALGTLAAKDLIKVNMDETVNERTLVSSVVAAWGMRDFTPAVNVGPVLVGLAHSDYTDSEIEEWIESTSSWNEGDLVAQEVSARKIRVVGKFEIHALATEAVVLNDGRQIKTKLNWILLQGQTLSVWAYNVGSAAIATTDPTISVNGHANLWPKG